MKTTIKTSKAKWKWKPITFRGRGFTDEFKQSSRGKKLPPLVTSGGDGLTEEFEGWNWNNIRDEIYRGHGA
jgi:hypothetical protein